MFYEIVHSYIHVLEQQKGILERSTVLSIEDVARDKANKISTLTVKAINTSICQVCLSSLHFTGSCKCYNARLVYYKLITSVIYQRS